MATDLKKQKKKLSDFSESELYFVDKEPAKECAICMDLIGEKDRTVLKCGHEFHASCMITNVVSANNTCPFCREEVGKKPEARPKFTRSLMRLFVQNEFNSIVMSRVLEGIFNSSAMLMNNDVNVWNNISSDQRIEMSQELIELLVTFGIRLGRQVNTWIEEGDGRMEVPDEMEDEPFSIPVSAYSDRGMDGVDEEKDYDNDDIYEDDDMDPDMPPLEEPLEEGEELEPINLRPLFEEEEDKDDYYDYTVDDFLEYWVEENDRQVWSARLLESEWLSDFNNFADATIEDLMWPAGGSGTRPLFSRTEAERIMGYIIRYHASPFLVVD
jgi:hypothetical protein